MAAEFSQYTINERPIDIFAEAEQLLDAQHMIQATNYYSGGSYIRTVDVLEDRSFNFYNPCIGRGEDSHIERALVRAMFTSEQARLLGRHPEDFMETDSGYILPDLRGDSQFDQMFSFADTELTLTKDDGLVTADVMSPEIRKPSVSVTQPDILSAIEAATQGFHFRRKSPRKITKLPVTLFR